VSRGEVVELDGPPDLRRVYARAVADAATTAGRTVTVGPDDVATDAILLRGVRSDADRLTAYQQLVGEPVSDLLPAGFVHVLTFPLSIAHLARAVPLPLLGMVHLANRVTQHRPVRLDEDLDIRVHAADLRAHRKGVAIDVVAEALTDDDVVWHGVSTYLAKGARIAGGAEAAQEGDRADFTAPAPTGLWHLTADTGRRYAAVSGDRNPIHTSRVAARAFGFPRRIAHGMYSAARVLAEVGPSARGDASEWDVEFARPVLLPSTVAVRIAPDGGPDGAMRFAAWSQRSGKPHLSGSVIRS
jgi:acyl dehydratase